MRFQITELEGKPYADIRVHYQADGGDLIEAQISVTEGLVSQTLDSFGSTLPPSWGR